MSETIKTNEPYLVDHKSTKYFLKQVTRDGTEREFPGPYPGVKTLNEFVEMIGNPKEGGVYYLVKRVETVKETVIRSIPNK